MSRAQAVLRTVLGDYPHVAPLRSGEVTGVGVTLDFQDVAPVNRAFAPMVRDEAYDLSELAVVTALQAIAYGRPVLLLPAVVAARFQRACLVGRADGVATGPQDLAGRRVGARAWSQTTAMWVRAHLAEDYGIAPEQLHWLTRDPSHVREYVDPPFVERRLGDADLADQLRDGRIDAAVFGYDLPEGDGLAPVVPDAAARDEAWWRQHGFVPINHMVVAGYTAVRNHPDAVREAYAALRSAAAATPTPAGSAPPTLFGFEQLREPVALVADLCLTQGLLPRPLGADEVLDPARELLGRLGD